MSSQALPPIQTLLLHRGAMLLIDEMTDFSVDAASVQATPRTHQWYCDETGNMPAWVGVELMAQAIAAHTALEKLRQGLPVKMGALLGTRRYESSVPFFKAGIALSILVQRIMHDGAGLGAYDCKIMRKEETLASACLTVYEPEDFASFLKGQA